VDEPSGRVLRLTNSASQVLFYFATSPFFDQLSSNQDLVSQWGGTPEESSMIGTRAVYEGNLRKRRGIQFVIVLDPLESKAIVQGPHGPEPSNVWVIRKQLREGETDNRVTILDYYYIVDDVIYQSPSVAGVLACRMVCVMRSSSRLPGCRDVFLTVPVEYRDSPQ